MSESLRFLVCYTYEVGCNGESDHEFFFVDVPLERTISIHDYVKRVILDRYPGIHFGSFSLWSLLDSDVLR